MDHLCRRRFLWEPYDPYRQDRVPWKMAAQLYYDRTNEHLRMLILLDKMARKVVEEFVNFGWVDHTCCVDLHSAEQFSQAANASVSGEGAGYGSEYVEQVRALGLDLVQKLRRGENFETRNEALTARLLERAAGMSAPCLQAYEQEGDCGGGGGEEEEEG